MKNLSKKTLVLLTLALFSGCNFIEYQTRQNQGEKPQIPSVPGDTEEEIALSINPVQSFEFSSAVELEFSGECSDKAGTVEFSLEGPRSASAEVPCQGGEWSHLESGAENLPAGEYTAQALQGGSLARAYFSVTPKDDPEPEAPAVDIKGFSADKTMEDGSLYSFYVAGSCRFEEQNGQLNAVSFYVYPAPDGPGQTIHSVECGQDNSFVASFSAGISQAGEHEVAASQPDSSGGAVFGATKPSFNALYNPQEPAPTIESHSIEPRWKTNESHQMALSGSCRASEDYGQNRVYLYFGPADLSSDFYLYEEQCSQGSYAFSGPSQTTASGTTGEWTLAVYQLGAQGDKFFSDERINIEVYEPMPTTGAFRLKERSGKLHLSRLDPATLEEREMELAFSHKIERPMVYRSVAVKLADGSSAILSACEESGKHGLCLVNIEDASLLDSSPSFSGTGKTLAAAPALMYVDSGRAAFNLVWSGGEESILVVNTQNLSDIGNNAASEAGFGFELSGKIVEDTHDAFIALNGQLELRTSFDDLAGATTIEQPCYGEQILPHIVAENEVSLLDFPCQQQAGKMLAMNAQTRELKELSIPYAAAKNSMLRDFGFGGGPVVYFSGGGDILHSWDVTSDERKDSAAGPIDPQIDPELNLAVDEEFGAFFWEGYKNGLRRLFKGHDDGLPGRDLFELSRPEVSITAMDIFDMPHGEDFCSETIHFTLSFDSGPGELHKMGACDSDPVQITAASGAEVDFRVGENSVFESGDWGINRTLINGVDESGTKKVYVLDGGSFTVYETAVEPLEGSFLEITP